MQISQKCKCGAPLQRKGGAYARRWPTRCAACQARLNRAHWRARRARLKISDGVKAGKHKTFRSFQSIADQLHLSKETVREGYRHALLKLREGGGEALREVLQHQGLNGLMEILRPPPPPGDPSLRLLEYQMAIAELWWSHARLVACQKPAAALKVRVAIERLQKRISKMIRQYLK